MWIKLFLKFPKEYIEAFLSNSYGYWYPQAINLIIPDWYDYAEDELIQYEKSKLIQIPMMEKINNAINQRKIPLMSIIFSIGFTFWVILICICYTIYKKKYRHLLIYIPILALWLTTIASPVWCEYRYIYSMFTSIPLLTIVNINLLNRNKDQNE